MSIAMPQLAKNENDTSMICIDSYENEVMIGRIYNVFYQEPLKFHGLVAFLKTMEGVLNSLDKPQANMLHRRFQEDKKDEKKLEKQINFVPQSIPDCKGKLATFKIRIAFRQNASWQGIVYWMEEGKEESFRSALELILLISDTFHDKKKSDRNL